MVRGLALLVGLTAAMPAIAGEMSAEEARHFVIGKMFTYTCFEGTRGKGRVFPDGSVVGSIQFQGSGPTRFAALPAGTLHTDSGAVCATLHGLPMQPCFNIERTAANSFRGSISGLGFAYCDFTHQQGRAVLARRANNEHPLALRPSLSADNN
jgi:hypothetical protein